MPEVQIGAFSNVPDHSPLTSPWAKDITRAVIHTFDDAADRAANWATPHEGAESILLDFPWEQWRYIGGAWHSLDHQSGHLNVTTNASGGFVIFFNHAFRQTPSVVANVGGAVAGAIYSVGIIDASTSATAFGGHIRRVTDGASMVSAVLRVYFHAGLIT